MKIIKQIPPEKTFDLPEGNYKATLTQIKPLIKQTKKGPQDWVRFLFEVQVPSLRNCIPCAGRNFVLDLNRGSDLRNFLEVWLGTDFFTNLSGQSLDFDTLLGREADLRLTHYQTEAYNKPHVQVTNAWPAGSLQLECEKATSISPQVQFGERSEPAKV